MDEHSGPNSTTSAPDDAANNSAVGDGVVAPDGDDSSLLRNGGQRVQSADGNQTARDASIGGDKDGSEAGDAPAPARDFDHAVSPRLADLRKDIRNSGYDGFSLKTRNSSELPHIGARLEDDTFRAAFSPPGEFCGGSSTEKCSSPQSASMIDSKESSIYTSLDSVVEEKHDNSSSNLEKAESIVQKVDKGKGKEVINFTFKGPAQSTADQKNQPSMDVPWEKDPERPLQKLPIRFTDAVGRHFIWPWKSAKTWKGARRLIESAFLHVNILEPLVLAGHYDLVMQGIWNDPRTAAINPSLASYPSSTPPEPTPASESSTSSSSASSSGPSPTEPAPKSGREAIILPELWEDIIEPGMLIVMHMWPVTASPPAPPPPGPPPTTVQHHHHHHHHTAPTNMGRGGGAPMPPPPGWPNPRRVRPSLIVTEYKPPKGKMRKRQDGL